MKNGKENNNIFKAIYGLFVEKGRVLNEKQWIAPTREQTLLEGEMEALVLEIIRVGTPTVTDTHVTYPTGNEKRTDIEKTAEDILDRAYVLGVALGKKQIKKLSMEKDNTSEHIVEKSIRSFHDAATNISKGILARIHISIEGTINKIKDKTNNTKIVRSTIVDKVIQNANDKYPGMVATTEISKSMHTGLLDTLADSKVKYIHSISSPGACGPCLENESMGSIPLGDSFFTGHKSSPFHTSCRCNIIATTEEE